MNTHVGGQPCLPCKKDNANFEGKAALIAQTAAGLKLKLVLLAINTDIDTAAGSEPVYSNGRVVGECASVSYGHRCEKNLVLAYINVDALAADDLQVRIIGAYLSASVTKVCIHDSEGEKLTTYLSK